jgi:CheY-like chemotaxis protein
LDPLVKDIVIIAASASAFDKDREKSELAGCDGFLAKPIQAQELFALLKTYLKLEWIYEEIKDETGRINTHPAELVVPPPEEMAILLDLAKSGKVRRIRERADHLIEMSQEYVPFANKLQQLAQTFQEKAILALIEQYIE